MGADLNCEDDEWIFSAPGYETTRVNVHIPVYNEGADTTIAELM